VPVVGGVQTQLAEDAIKSAEQPRKVGRPFEPGNNANPAGRPAGSRNKATLILDALADGEAEEILKMVLEAATGGDARAQEMFLARCWPARKSRKVSFTIPPMEKASDLVTGLQAVLDATANGDLTPDEASTIGSLIEAKRKAIETAEIEQRLSRLEAAQEGQRTR
jgi:hypothetical protein